MTPTQSAAEQFAPNEAGYAALLGAFSTFTWVADASGKFRVPQPGWEQYTGHGFEHYCGSCWIEGVHPHDRAQVSEIWRRAVRNKSWYQAEWRCWHGATQTWRRCCTRGVPLLNADGSVREWVAAVRDIESELNVDPISELEWLRHAQASSGLALWEYNPTTRNICWSSEVDPLSHGPASVSYPELCTFIHAEDRGRVLAAQIAIASTGAIDVLFRIVRPSGEVRWLHSKGARMPGEHAGRVAGAIIDITEQIELHEHLAARTRELAQANRHLVSANEQLRQFNYAVSHDLCDPLREVSIFAQMIVRRLSGHADEDVRNCLRICSDGSLRVQRILDDLLIYTRVSAGAPVLVEPVDSRQALEEARLNLHTLIEESRATIEVGRLPALRVNYPALLHLFQNLLSNAIQFRSAALPLVQLSARREGEYWKFAVRDNGIGIDPKHHREIFGLFRRLDAAPGGSGIGLSICRTIVERSGGRIWVESKLGHGSVFYFTLPASF